MMRSLFAGRSWLFLGIGASLLLSLGVVGRFPEQVMQLNPLMLVASLLVAVGVGVWSAQLGGKALWAVPLSFVLVMLAGTLMAQTSVALIVSKSFVLLSMFVLGMLIAGNICFATHVAAAMVAMLAFAHGRHVGIRPWLYPGQCQSGCGRLDPQWFQFVFGLSGGNRRDGIDPQHGGGGNL
ncbi:HupE/UreJ family protein [Shewanella algae]|uniref:HupE/UreJ family protein n=1 Tax=Shewanella algae TaxID=38313 RepID=UPI0034D620A7